MYMYTRGHVPCSSIFAHGSESVQNVSNQHQTFELVPKACNSL